MLKQLLMSVLLLGKWVIVRLPTCGSNKIKLGISVDDVQTAILQQKSGKAVGPDGIHIEAYKFGGHKLTVYLTLFFNSCLRCGDLMCSVYAPLVKK